MNAWRGLPDKVLPVGWWLLMALLPIGHLTGLRNTWTVLVAVATLVWVRKDAWQDLPARATLLLLLAWCASSIGWSTVPAISFGKWRSDLLIPLLAYAAAFGYVRRTGSIATILGGMICGLVALALLSAFAFVPAADLGLLPRWIRTESFPNVDNPMPVWYPGVGDASMAASLATGVLVFLRALTRTVARWVRPVAWASMVSIVLVANNRNAQIAIPLVALACLWLLRRRTDRAVPTPRSRSARAVRGALVAGLVVALVVGVGARLESGARERLEALRIPVSPGSSAFVQLTSRDTRPMIWSYYGRLALDSPWIGVGFGRTVPGIHFHTEDDRALALVETNAYSHAHNLFLNWWLQTGVVGVALLVVALAQVVVCAMRVPPDGRSDGQARAAGLALVATVVLMLIRDATDDFLIYGMATMFWVLLGGLAALRMPAISARRDP